MHQVVQVSLRCPRRTINMPLPLVLVDLTGKQITDINNAKSVGKSAIYTIVPIDAQEGNGLVNICIQFI
jgi:hypothetical protein